MNSSNNRLYSSDTSVTYSDLYENEIEECMICLEPLNNEVAEISCSHKYHYKCIKEWIKTNNNILKACCICEKNTEIINIKSFDSYINQNNINVKGININDNRLNINEENSNENNSLFGCCNIL